MQTMGDSDRAVAAAAGERKHRQRREGEGGRQESSQCTEKTGIFIN